MRPRRTHHSNSVFELDGGNEDNALWLHADHDAEVGVTLLRSTWVPSDDERARIAAGENIELVVYGPEHPPVSMAVVDYPLGKPPKETAA